MSRWAANYRNHPDRSRRLCHARGKRYGTGIEKRIEHIFEPFLHHKGLGKGTGLGLPTCYGIVKQNHGTIQVYSEPGKGTTMKVYLPAIDEDAPAQMLKKDLQLPRGTETVLVVEDDSALREMVVRILKGSGYTVIAMPDGRKAIDEAAGLGQYVDMLVTDVIMPRMGGRELANRIVEYFRTSGFSICPDIPTTPSCTTACSNRDSTSSRNRSHRLRS